MSQNRKISITKNEQVTSQSAAEFFSEHQQIAGYDNPGKSLFTTIREFIENSLDAAESMYVLPDVDLYIEEFSELHHNELHGINTGISTANANANTNTPANMANTIITSNSDSIDHNNNVLNQSSQITLNTEEDDEDNKVMRDTTTTAKKTKKQVVENKEKEQMYYLIKCVDNGCGIIEENIGNMLGKVLSGSKHGIRQTRGKFGLGAKMALIWSKKSSGLPIKIRTAHSSNANVAPSHVTTIVLDIDIYRNEPRILHRTKEVNTTGWRGTEISVTISGNWGNYRARILQYFQQLAVITPYAKLSLDFKCHKDSKKSFHAEFERRSEQMPPIAEEIQPHPKSLNNITLSNLLQTCKANLTIDKFLVSELSGIHSNVASRITSALNISSISTKSLQPSQIAALIQLLRDEKQIKPPLGHCLSPAGEYNMRLGVMKELKPKMIATFSDKSGSHEGHPFLVEAAISLGGTNLREGINVYRFANRIPLLFEAGADVVTQVATKRINWSSYHIDPKKDNIGVYVSIVSTRIPFKGTSKEYVGEDVAELFQSVRRALQGCCQQLRVNLAKGLALKEEQERKKTLVKYIPNISNSLYNILQKMHVKLESSSSTNIKATSDKASKGLNKTQLNTLNSTATSNYKDHLSQPMLKLLEDFNNKTILEKTLVEHLQIGVDKFESDSIMLSSIHAAATDSYSNKIKKKLFILANASLYIDHHANNMNMNSINNSNNNINMNSINNSSNNNNNNMDMNCINNSNNNINVMDNISNIINSHPINDEDGVNSIKNETYINITQNNNTPSISINSNNNNSSIGIKRKYLPNEINNHSNTTTTTSNNNNIRTRKWKKIILSVSETNNNSLVVPYILLI